MKKKILPVFSILALLTLTNFSSPILKVIEAFLLIIPVLQFISFDFISLKKIIEQNRLLLFYFFIVSIGALRNNDPKLEFSSIIVIVLFFALFVVLFSSQAIYYIHNNYFDTIHFIVTFIVLPYTLFAILNYVLLYLNINPTVKVLEEGDTGNAVLLSYLGFNVRRIIFPLASGLNEYATFIGGILGLSFWLFLAGKKMKIFLLVAIFITVTSVLFVDSRTAVLYPILFPAVLYVIFKLKLNNLPKLFKYLAALIVLGPFLYIYLLPAISTNNAVNSVLSRHSNDLATGNTRFEIWKITLNELSSIKPVHVIGYGQVGHYGSGVSLKWASFFKGWKNAEMKSPHDTFFSLVFDEGYIGLLIYLAIVYQSLKKAGTLWQSKPAVGGAIIVFLIYAIIDGISESLGGFTLINFSYLFFMVVITINTEYAYLNKRQIYIVTHES